MRFPFFSRSSFLVVGIVVLVASGLFALHATGFFSPVTIISVEPQFASMAKIEYLAPKTVIAQSAPSNNKLLKLSCPWAVGPQLFFPGLDPSQFLGSCPPPSCPLSHPEEAAVYCVPMGMDIPFTVVPTQSSTILYPPPPTYYAHQTVGANSTFPIPPTGGNPPIDIVVTGDLLGGNGGGGAGVGLGPMSSGTSCSGRLIAPPSGATGGGLWCGGSCPNPNETCKPSGAGPTCTCQPRDTAINVGPLGGIETALDDYTMSGPLVYPTASSEPGGGITEPDITGELSPAENENAFLFAAPPAPPGGGSAGLYTPQTHWFGVVGICARVCR